MMAKFRGKKWRRHPLAALALAALSGPGHAASEPGVHLVQHEYKLYNPLADAIFNDEKHVRKKAGAMLVDGDCTGAKEYALWKGRPDVASAVDRQCRLAARARISTVFLSGMPPVIVAPRRIYARSDAPARDPARIAPIVINDYSVPLQH